MVVNIIWTFICWMCMYICMHLTIWKIIAIIVKIVSDLMEYHSYTYYVPSTLA